MGNRTQGAGPRGQPQATLETGEKQRPVAGMALWPNAWGPHLSLGSPSVAGQVSVATLHN